MKKKIGILTYHTGYNYGASLQAYALQTIVQNMGADCEIINFETEHFLASREMLSHKPRRVKEFIKIASRIPYASELKRRQQLFDRFTNEALKLSPLYRTEDEVKAHATDYACIICGSDQIWNLSTTDAPAANPIYFLNFPKQQKRVAYAPSFGKWVKEAPEHENIFLPWVKQFDAISVRETSGVEYLRSRGVDCTLALDPTVLLDGEQYASICAKCQEKEPYVLLFSWNCAADVIAAAKRVGEALKLPVVSLTPPPRAMFAGIRRKLDVGPSEFLSMIKNAQFVVTNSFHGTAFSVTMERPFASVVTENAPDPRMHSLMVSLGLEDHLVDADHIKVGALKNTDFSKARDRKAAMRRASLEFLEKAIGEYCHD